MLRPRVIPVLLLSRGGLVKTIKFSNPKYLGDPINTVRIFNDLEVDEIIVVDIEATALNRDPNYDLIAKLAIECRMPLCYGGGVKKASDLERIISLGVEKVAISSAAMADPDFISNAANRVGSQSVVVVMDVKKSGISSKRYELFTHNGRRPSGFFPVDFARYAESQGAGEIVVNSISRDGSLSGYDFDLIDQVRGAVSLPMTAIGGAGSITDIEALISRYGVIGAGAGSLFTLTGKFRAVLIQYLSRSERNSLANISFSRFS
jgi:cyclase